MNFYGQKVSPAHRNFFENTLSLRRPGTDLRIDSLSHMEQSEFLNSTIQDPVDEEPSSHHFNLMSASMTDTLRTKNTFGSQNQFSKRVSLPWQGSLVTVSSKEHYLSHSDKDLAHYEREAEAQKRR